MYCVVDSSNRRGVCEVRTVNYKWRFVEGTCKKPGPGESVWCLCRLEACQRHWGRVKQDCSVVVDIRTTWGVYICV